MCEINEKIEEYEGVNNNVYEQKTRVLKTG